jgi:8-oxo-dGTP pyrophosphatase MutT (NUDIX family)
MKSRTISAGAVITDGVRFLVCHATGQTIWDIPKGKVEPDEDVFQACLREIKEETDYDVPESAQIEELGLFPYLPAKDLYLFRITVDTPIDPDKLKCNSTFVNKEGVTLTEVNAFLFITFANAPKYISQNLFKTLELAGLLHGPYNPV